MVVVVRKSFNEVDLNLTSFVIMVSDLRRASTSTTVRQYEYDILLETSSRTLQEEAQSACYEGIADSSQNVHCH